MLDEKEINKQIGEHIYRKDEDHIYQEYVKEEKDLCRGAECPTSLDSSGKVKKLGLGCKRCIGDYHLKELIEVQPHLNWKNLKETILMAQVLGIKSQANK